MGRKVLIINQGGTDNIGDQAIKESLMMFLNNNNYEVSFQGFTSIPKTYKYDFCSDKPILANRFISKIVPSKISWYVRNKSIFNIIKQNKFDTIIIGGGQLINRNKIFSYAMYLWAKKIRKLNIKLYLFSVGAMEKLTFTDKILYSKAFHNMDGIYVRDEKSRDILKDIFHIDAKITYDVAFLFKKYDNFEGVHLKNENTVLFGFTEYSRFRKYDNAITKEQYYRRYLEKLKSLKEEKKDVVLFYTTKTDLKTAYEINDMYQKIENDSFVIANIQSISDLTNLLKTIKEVYSPRMHALILAHTYGCKVYPELLSDKIRMFTKTYIDSNIKLEYVIEKIEKDLLYILSS